MIEYPNINFKPITKEQYKYIENDLLKDEKNMCNLHIIMYMVFL